MKKTTSCSAPDPESTYAEPSPGATSGIGSRAEGAMSRERPGKLAGSHLLRGPCAATSDLLAGHASTIQEGVAQALACARGAHNFFPLSSVRV